MDKLNRKERIAVILGTLMKYPNKQYSLTHFCNLLNAAKSTMSEDLKIIREVVDQYDLGYIDVVAGASGGVRYIPFLSDEEEKSFLKETAKKLSDPQRILPGGFIYTIDILLNAEYADKMGSILAKKFWGTKPDFIVTAETKGIPLAISVARAMGKPLAIARRDNKITEGSVVTINYLSGSSRRLQSMSLSKRAVHEGQKALVIDDFIAGGGTVKALCDMMKEFNVTVTGCGAAIAMSKPEKKRVENYVSLFMLDYVDEEKGVISLNPS